MNNTIDKLTASIDAEILSTFPTSNFGSNTTLGVSGLTSTALIQFDLSSIPVGSTITQAIFEITRSNAGSATAFELFRLVRQWVEAETTWNIAETAVNWGTAGANNTSTDFDNTVLGTLTFGTLINEKKTADITQTVSDWHDGTNSNFGLKLAQTSGAGLYYSSENTLVVRAPCLLVTYTYPALDFQLNSNNIDSGIQAHWAPIPTGKKSDATQRTNADWRRHTWEMAFCEMDTWETLEPLKGTSFTELKTTGESVPNTVATYSTGRVLDVSGRQVGRRMENVKVNFFVKVS